MMWVLGIATYFAVGFGCAVLSACITHERFREEAAGWIVGWPICALYCGSSWLADKANDISRRISP